MPFAQIRSIREVSSECSNFPASNLIKQEAKKVWKTKDVGEKSAYIIFELEKPVQITGIDIGNEHSCFIEVLVSKSGCSPSDFTEILLTSSFMTPIESKNSTVVNRVRCFNSEALVQTACKEKWKFVKVICTQPFNKHVQYGLAFIKIHIVDDESKKDKDINKNLVAEKFLQQRRLSSDSNGSVDSKPPTVKAIGMSKFALREDSPDSESESTGALFKRWKTSRTGDSSTQPTTTAAAIRQASTTSGLQKIVTSRDTKVISRNQSTSREHASTSKKLESSRTSLDRNRADLLFDKEDEETSVKDKRTHRLEEQIEADREALQKRKEEMKKAKEATASKRKISTESSNKTKKADESFEKNTKGKSPGAKKIKLSSPTSPSISSPKNKKKDAKTQYKPFNELLRGVVLVISGIQNPDRGILRGKALEMGAKYKGDWETGCTHLICAFQNTPKYTQVKGHGKIVTRKWIEKCYALKKYLPWRRFALDNDDRSAPESDVEILDESLRPDDETNSNPPPSSRRDSTNSVEVMDIGVSEKAVSLDSGSDTDDDIQRVIQKNNESKATATKKKKSDENENDDDVIIKEKKSDENDNEDDDDDDIIPIKNKRLEVNGKDNDDVYEVSTEEEDYLKERLNKV